MPGSSEPVISYEKAKDKLATSTTLQDKTTTAIRNYLKSGAPGASGVLGMLQAGGPSVKIYPTEVLIVGTMKKKDAIEICGRRDYERTCHRHRMIKARRIYV
ncbi:hypothetical protein MMC19_005716 [Ptychographa xylographoides]|nr:hypothetical protein [Ptychographa xylographoides]